MSIQYTLTKQSLRNSGSVVFIPLQRRRSDYSTKALPIQLDNKDVNHNLDLNKVAERSSRKIYDKINVS